MPDPDDHYLIIFHVIRNFDFINFKGTKFIV